MSVRENTAASVGAAESWWPVCPLSAATDQPARSDRRNSTAISAAAAAAPAACTHHCQLFSIAVMVVLLPLLLLPFLFPVASFFDAISLVALLLLLLDQPHSSIRHCTTLLYAHCSY